MKNIFFKKLCKFLKPFQKKEILIRVITDSEVHTDIEKMELLNKLNCMDVDTIDKTFEKVVEELSGGGCNV